MNTVFNYTPPKKKVDCVRVSCRAIMQSVTAMHAQTGCILSVCMLVHSPRLGSPWHTQKPASSGGYCTLRRKRNSRACQNANNKEWWCLAPSCTVCIQKKKTSGGFLRNHIRRQDFVLTACHRTSSPGGAEVGRASGKHLMVEGVKTEIHKKKECDRKDRCMTRCKIREVQIQNKVLPWWCGGVAKDHGSCCLHCWTTTVAD